MKQKRRKYLYAAAALGMTFLLNLSGCSRRFTNYPEIAGTVAIVDSTEREAVRNENGENPDQPIDCKRSIASTCSSTPFSAIIVSHYTESKKLSTQLF